MFVVRPVRMDDWHRLVEIATSASFGLTSLPKDPDLLRKRILESLNSFAKTADKPRGEIYLFVLEDTSTGSVVGTSCIVSKVGGFEPFYALQGREENSRIGSSPYSQRDPNSEPGCRAQRPQRNRRPFPGS